MCDLKIIAAALADPEGTAERIRERNRVARIARDARERQAARDAVQSRVEAAQAAVDAAQAAVEAAQAALRWKKAVLREATKAARKGPTVSVETLPRGLDVEEALRQDEAVALKESKA